MEIDEVVNRSNALKLVIEALEKERHWEEECWFCSTHEAGDTLYEDSSWDGGIGFDYIRDIKYCPICGRRLADE